MWRWRGRVTRRGKLLASAGGMGAQVHSLAGGRVHTGCSAWAVSSCRRHQCSATARRTVLAASQRMCHIARHGVAAGRVRRRPGARGRQAQRHRRRVHPATLHALSSPDAAAQSGTGAGCVGRHPARRPTDHPPGAPRLEAPTCHSLQHPWLWGTHTQPLSASDWDLWWRDLCLRSTGSGRGHIQCTRPHGGTARTEAPRSHGRQVGRVVGEADALPRTASPLSMHGGRPALSSSLLRPARRGTRLPDDCCCSLGRRRAPHGRGRHQGSHGLSMESAPHL